MFIHSKFKDYYDGVNTHWRDSTIHWNRTTTHEFDTFGMKLHAGRIVYRNQDMYNSKGEMPWRSFTIKYVGFCGRFIPFIAAEKPYVIKRDYMYNMFEIEKHINESNLILSRADILYTLQQVSKIKSDALFIKYNTPIILVDNDEHIYLNPRLSDIDFYKCFDSWTCRIEIENYYSNILTKCPEIPEPSNDIKIRMAGFNLKKSFRKQKQNK